MKDTDLEDLRLVRLAQKTFRLTDGVVDAALSELEEQVRAGGESNAIRALHALGAITGEQVVELTRIRDRGRPGGLKIVRALGRGASATCYATRDEQGHLLAVKVMRGATERDYARREHEVRALARVAHPSIPRVVATGEVEGRPYHAMELVGGEALGDLCKARGKLDWKLVADVGLAVARALDHVHERGVVHRDVKPSNVLVTAGGGMLIDFGLACRPGTASAMRAVGTPGYISPELARGEDATFGSDIYSFGATLYYALTGTYAFDAETAPEMIRLAADPDVVVKPVLAHREDLPARLIAVVERCLEKDPALRYESMSDVVAALERVCASGSRTPTRRMVAARPLASRAARRRRLARKLFAA